MQAPALQVRVCTGLCCEMAGAQGLLEQLPGFLGGSAQVEGSACVGRCDQAPVLLVGAVVVARATPEDAMNAVMIERSLPGDEQGLPEPVLDFQDYENYRAEGGYAMAATVAGSDELAQAALEAIEASGLRSGLTPVAQLWREMRVQPPPRAMAVRINAGEPGTFTDRHLLERDPHRFLEGMLIAAQLTGTAAIHLHVRQEQPECTAMLEGEMEQLRANPPCDLPLIEVREGEPPPPGALGCETLHWVRDILEKGPGWFAGFGRNGSRGLRMFGVAGRVCEPGVKVAPAGITVSELVEEYCGGMPDGDELLGALDGQTLVVLGRQDQDRAAGKEEFVAGDAAVK
jgi:hypothetical protein